MLYARNLRWMDKALCKLMNSDPGSTRKKPDFKSRVKKPERHWVPGRGFKLKIILVSAFVIVLVSSLYSYLLLGRGRHSEISRVALSGNIGQEGGGGKMSGLFPVSPADQESLASRTLDRPEIIPPAEDKEGKMEGGAAEKVVPERQQKVTVIGNRDSKRYHLPGMKYYDRILAYHRVEFDSEEAAIQAGYHKAPE